MADTYDLAMQLFRVASEKQKIEKSQGKLKPEDEIQFTEASFNDFSSSLSNEFSGLSEQEKSEAARLLQLKIQDNVNEVISGNSNQGFSLNVQSVRVVINTAVKAVQTNNLEQSQVSQTQGTQKQGITVQDALDNYKNNNNIQELHENLQSMSVYDRLTAFDKMDVDTIEALLEQQIREAEQENPSLMEEDELPYGGSTPLNIVLTKQQASEITLEKLKSGKKYNSILEGNCAAMQYAYARTNKKFEAKNDFRYRLVSKVLYNSSLSPEQKRLILSREDVYEEYCSSIIRFAKTSAFRGVSRDKITFEYILENSDDFNRAYSTRQKELDFRFVNKKAPSKEYLDFGEKLLNWSGLPLETKQMIRDDPFLVADYANICCCIYRDVQNNNLNNLNKGNIKLYFQKLMPDLPDDVLNGFDVQSLGSTILTRIYDGSFEQMLDKFSISNKEVDTAARKMNQQNIKQFLEKSDKRRVNIRNCLNNNPALSHLSKDKINQLAELMVQSYSNKLIRNDNVDVTSKIGNFMLEEFVDKNIQQITTDPSVIDTVMDIVHKSNLTQSALNFENSPVHGINLYVKELGFYLGFKKENPTALISAIKESFISSYPEKMDFDPDVFAKTLKVYGVEYDEETIKDPGSFSYIKMMIQSSHDRYMKEAIYAGAAISRENIDDFNFEKDVDLSKQLYEDISIEKNPAFSTIDSLKEKYGVTLAVPFSEPPSIFLSSFMNFKDNNERRDFIDVLNGNHLFALEYTNMIKKMQQFVEFKGSADFNQELLDDFKNAYFSDANKELSNSITLDKMQGIFTLVKNKDLDEVLSVSKADDENIKQYLDKSEDEGSYNFQYTNRTNAFKKKYQINKTITRANLSKSNSPSFDSDDLLEDQPIENDTSSTDIVSKSEQSYEENATNQNSDKSPVIQQGGLIGFINRFRNNMHNRNKDEGIFTSIKNAFLNAKNSFSEEVIDNKTDNDTMSKENQSSTETSKPTNTLDEMSKRLREGINVDNLGVQNTKTNNEVKNSDQREAESEEEQL